MGREVPFRKVLRFANKVDNIEYIKRLTYSVSGTGVTYAHVPS